MNTIAKIFFIIMNLFGPPLAQIVFAILWGWTGFFISLSVFYMTYNLWKHFAKIDATLTFNPKINRWWKKEN